MSERRVTMKGDPMPLTGDALEAGQDAPDFTALNPDLEEVTMADLEGRPLILASVPSLDTSVCSLETKKFNERAAELGDDVRMVTISMDLPFAQARWTEAEDVENVLTLSDHRSASFGRAYGVLIEPLRLLARAVFVVDAAGKIRHAQIVPEMTDEPDYDAVLAAVAAL